MREPLDEWLTEATAIAVDAGKLLLNGWRGDLRVHKKGAIDLVTDYDLRSEALLRERMTRAFPSHALVAEEGEDQVTGDWVWYVDPLDGTTNFAHGHFFFAVSIGLALRGRPVLGVVHAPALGVTWTAAEGRSATRNGEPCSVSTTATLADALVATGFPYDRATTDEDNLREAVDIIPRVQGIRRCGSAALDLCLVADGTYDGYWEQKVKPWDVCAGMIIARAAGARITDYDGSSATVGSSQLVTAGPSLHPSLLAAVRRARERKHPAFTQT